MRNLLTALLLILAVSCTKSGKEDDPEFVTCLVYEYPAWLTEITKGLTNCECPISFYVGSYNGQEVFVLRTTSASCCGFDVVYDTKGNKLFPNYPASNIEEYKKYLAEVTGLREIWRCSKATKQ